jgi:glycosyltransferase involved in cell wall biosynthesis
MSRVLVLTTDLPFFPGKMGVDFFNLRHLARTHAVSVVAPIYPGYPSEGVKNLERFLEAGYFWPRPAAALAPGAIGVADEPALLLWPLIARLPARLRWWLLRRLLHIAQRPGDAYDKLTVLSICAPQLLQALTRHHFPAVVLVQTAIEPWFDYLPAMGGKFVLFHDVRTDYLARAIPAPGQAPVGERELQAIRRQEQAVCARADGVGFVSELDCQRAAALFDLPAVAGVAPIPVDTDYFTPAPAHWQRDPRAIVLFSGHLSHPPNVDAVLHFLERIWPHVLERRPDAVFQVVGMLPADIVQQRIAAAPRCELHANVPDVRPYFWNAAAYVVPMRFGGGVRQKLFEAWSMRVPVVCTGMAAEGTGAAQQGLARFADAPAEFADRVVELLAPGAGAQTDAMRATAARFVDERHAIGAAAPHFQSLVERTVAVRRRRPFKLLFDLRWMEIGVAGGIEQGVYDLIGSIGQLDRRNDFRIYAPRSTCCEWDLPAGFSVRMHHSDAAPQRLEAIGAAFANRLALSLWRRPILSPPMRALARYRRLDFDMVHSINSYIHPDLIGFPGIVTVNDLQHLRYPQFFSAEEFALRERLYRESVERARHVICISEFTRQEVHRLYGVPLEKMSTVWLSPSRNVWQPMGAAQRRTLLEAMGLDGPFLLYPAHGWAHKNHARLVEAFDLVAAELPARLRLVFTGRPFTPDHPAAALIQARGLERRIVHLGFRSPLEIRALFQACEALVFPSLFEGFGIPVTEAIMLGKPVACSNVTSLPEIAGDAALTFDPDDTRAIGAALLAVATPSPVRDHLAEAARRRRPIFSGRRRAIETLAVYHRVYDELYGS